MEKKNGKKKIMPNGLRDYSHLPRAKDYPPINEEELSEEMREYVKASREAARAIAEAFERGEITITR